MCDFADIPHAVGNFQQYGRSSHKTPNLCEIFLSSRQICEEEWLLMTMATCVEAKAIRRELCRNCVPAGKKLESYIAVTLSLSSGTTRNRTGDTRIFSPLLYQLSYGTISAVGAAASQLASPFALSTRIPQIFTNSSPLSSQSRAFPSECKVTSTIVRLSSRMQGCLHNR